MGFLAAVGAICMIIAIILLPLGVVVIIYGALTKDRVTTKTGLTMLVRGGLLLLLSFSFCSWSGFHL